MKEATFGIEIELTGISRKAAAQAMAQHFGTNRYEHPGFPHDRWTVYMPDGRTWAIENDGSVTQPACELVSPVCGWDDIEMVQETVRAMRAAGLKADKSCGIHVHIGGDGHDAQSLRRLVNIVNAKEDLLTLALGNAPRRDSWCKPVDPTFLALLNAKKPGTLDEFAHIWYGTNDADNYGWHGLDACRSEHYNSSRYHLLNLHAFFSTERPAHTIEFRAFNGTTHAGKIKSYIQLCMAINWMALSTKSASAKRPETDNPRYTFRCWLLRLGFIGDEFETARKWLLDNLAGDTAFRNGRP